MSAFNSSAVSSAQTGHPITRVAALPSTSSSSVVLVCAGGSHLSVQPAPRALFAPASNEHSGSPPPSAFGGGNFSHLQAGGAADFSQPQPSACGVEVGKGSTALLASVQQWAAARNAQSGAASPLLSEQRASLRCGEVSSLCVAPLPSTDAAVAVVGTTAGTVALFLLEGSRSVCPVAECALAGWSGGGITAQDAVVDVSFSMDPAGRPEFVAAASASCVVVVDVQRLYRAHDANGDSADDDGDDDDEEQRGSGVTASVRRTHGTSQRSSPQPGDVWSTSALRARAIEALERPNHQLVQRSRSAVFTAAFPEANVVRVLSPQRLCAAVALDVALVVVLSDGTLHYVERVIEGGSVRLLEAHHRQRFAEGSPFIAYAQNSMLCDPSDRAAAKRGSGAAADASISLLTDSRAMPHVVYRYRLSPMTVQVCAAGQSSSSSSGRMGGNGLPNASPSAADLVTHVNDAALYFSEKDAVCHLVVAGTQPVPTSTTKASARHMSASHLGSGVSSPTDTAAAAGAGWTLGRLRQQQQQQQQQGGSGSAVSHRLMGWWAVVQNAVLPRCTLNRAALERQAVQQHQRAQNALAVVSTSSSSSSTAAAAATTSVFGSAATAFNGEGGSPFMVHVLSGVMALPAASLTTSLSPSNSGRSVAAAAAAAARAAGDTSGVYDGPASPTMAASPTGTGAHLAASNTSAGVGCGFSMATMAGDVFVLAAGADIYAGSMREVTATSSSLPLLRPVRNLGAVVETLSFVPHGDARSVLVASGSRVVPVTL